MAKVISLLTVVLIAGVIINSINLNGLNVFIVAGSLMITTSMVIIVKIINAKPKEEHDLR